MPLHCCLVLVSAHITYKADFTLVICARDGMKLVLCTQNLGVGRSSST